MEPPIEEVAENGRGLAGPGGQAHSVAAIRQRDGEEITFGIGSLSSRHG
jgi:hypothetical protein